MGGFVLMILALVLGVCSESGRWYDTIEQRQAKPKHVPGVPRSLLKGSSFCCCRLFVFHGWQTSSRISTFELLTFLSERTKS